MKKTALFVATSLTAASILAAQKPDPFKEFPEKYWDFSMIEKIPAFRDAPAAQQVKGLRGILVEGFGPKADDKNFDANNTLLIYSPPTVSISSVL